ncbi:NADP-dependent oxidoreductase [Chitinophaga filiformis]|uniref:NADP-dependent oxidoreductase n=1 Tax=Chitinophaga filiformis TaxID=104663 RepID=UPI001F1577E0|nr:NADP-dependent oxidoreductase [Chitinophaga filiformis]MCF6404895.1 NADP-dependent oxidoreductase [Chitinophaga filiformis]
MEAYILTQNGGIETLQRTTLPTPQPAAGEVLIKTKGIGINPIDSQVRSSKEMLNMITNGNTPDIVVIGWDIAGIIEQVGAGVEGFTAGDEVFGLINMPGLGSTYATHVTAPASQISLKPSKLSFTTAAATPMAALTAWQAVVTLAKVQKGERVLIHGASGGVGHLAVQLAKYLGAYVIGTGSAKNESFILGLGADEFIDYATTPFEQQVKEMDVVIDTVHSIPHVLRSITVVKTGGRLIYLQPHFQSALSPLLEAAHVAGHGVFVHSSGKELREIASLIENGYLQPHVSTVLSFDQLPEAHRLQENGKPAGKIAVAVS